MHIMFICHGNICRSPMAERVAQRLADEARLDVRLSSAGISSEEEGNPIDHRAAKLLTAHGYDAAGHVARELVSAMCDDVDLFVVAEQHHARRVAGLGVEPERIRLITDFDPEARTGAPLPDPWYGDMREFEETLQVLERALPVLLDEVC